jgi:peptidoglycan/LPS O-acetylase OafA/YrhL
MNERPSATERGLGQRRAQRVRPAAWLAVALAAALATGCATQKIDWNARVGTYTYDQAVLELGPPDKSADLSDGTRVAEWLTQRGYSSVYVDGFHGGYYRPWYGIGFYQGYGVRGPDQFLRLTFGPDGHLRTWERVSR